jgi:hypothetical protein
MGNQNNQVKGNHPDLSALRKAVEVQKASRLSYDSAVRMLIDVLVGKSDLMLEVIYPQTGTSKSVSLNRGNVEPWLNGLRVYKDDINTIELRVDSYEITWMTITYI